MATMIVKERAQKMSEAVAKGLITPFEEKVINRAVDILHDKVKCLFNSNIFAKIMEDDLCLVEDVIEGFFNNTVYVTALRSNGIELKLYQTNCIVIEEGLAITSIIFKVILTERRAKDEIDITDMIEGTRGRNHHIINPKYEDIYFYAP